MWRFHKKIRKTGQKKLHFNYSETGMFSGKAVLNYVFLAECQYGKGTAVVVRGVRIPYNTVIRERKREVIKIFNCRK